jgi:hypothetical protein
MYSQDTISSDFYFFRKEFYLGTCFVLSKDILEILKRSVGMGGSNRLHSSKMLSKRASSILKSILSVQNDIDIISVIGHDLGEDHIFQTVDSLLRDII